MYASHLSSWPYGSEKIFKVHFLLVYDSKGPPRVTSFERRYMVERLFKIIVVDLGISEKIF